ncbi:MAG: hypothetical protein H7834_01115 [Magnetococcus sp. YQC-9]
MDGLASTRRLFLLQGLLLGTVLVPGGCAWLPVRQGMRRVGSDTRIGERQVGEDALVKPGDKVSTGSGGRAVLVMGEDAFLLGMNTRLRFHEAWQPTPTPEPSVAPGELSPDVKSSAETAADPRAKGFTLYSGRVLSVFGSGGRTLKIPTATLGIRGTGIYLEVAEEQDYVCLCYGHLDIRMNDDPRITESYQAHHHSARILAAHSPIRKAPGVNHTDEELFMLEALVNRRPPFDPEDYSGH